FDDFGSQVASIIVIKRQKKNCFNTSHILPRLFIGVLRYSFPSGEWARRTRQSWHLPAIPAPARNKLLCRRRRQDRPREKMACENARGGPAGTRERHSESGSSLQPRQSRER